MTTPRPLTRVLSALALCAGVLAGSGCVAGAVGADEPPNATFDLVTPAAVDAPSPARGVQVLVPEPVAVAVLASQRVLVRVSPREVQYLAGARYTDTLTKLTQFKLKRALESSRSIGAAALPGEGLAIDYQILTDIRAFEVRATPAVVASTDPVAVSARRTAYVSLLVKILNDRNGNVVASRVFDSSVPVGPIVGDRTNEAYLAALDAALDAALVDIRAFVGGRV